MAQIVVAWSVFLVVAYQNLGIVAGDHFTGAFGGVAQPCQDIERWNLPIAGGAAQMGNRVQYSLSALVHEDRPIFVMSSQRPGYS